MRSIPNIISVTRCLLVIPYVWFLVRGSNLKAALILALLIILTDKLDGFLARRLKCTSQLGATLDSVADNAFVIASWFALYARAIFDVKILLLILAPRVLLIAFVISFRMLHKRWNTEHLFGDKIIGLTNYLLILWLLAEFPYAVQFIWIIIVFNYLGALVSGGQRHGIFSLPQL